MEWNEQANETDHYILLLYLVGSEEQNQSFKHAFFYNKYKQKQCKIDKLRIAVLLCKNKL